MSRIVHVVLLEWPAGTPSDVRDLAREIVRGFRTNISGVVAVDEGPGVSPENLEDGYDYGFVITFVDEAARDAYHPNPVHVELADLLSAHSARVVVYDLESDGPASRVE